jgi:predicted SAM-dependent methyltransferase
VKLNLGCSDRHFRDFVCIDIAPPPCVECGDPEPRKVDLSEEWPFADSSIDEVLALDVCEHIGNGYRLEYDLDIIHVPYENLKGEGVHSHDVLSEARIVPFNGRIHFLNELHRVLVPGGRATIETPNAAKGVGYFQDPTHTSQYCRSTFKYFEFGTFAHGRLSKAYGITAAFKILSMTESRSNGEDPSEEVWKLNVMLEAVK